MFVEITNVRKVGELYLANLLWYLGVDGQPRHLPCNLCDSPTEADIFLREWDVPDRRLYSTYGIVTEE